MRKKEKEIIDRNELDQIIHNSLICHLSCCLDNQPYLVPLSFGYDGDAVYFHTALKGKKIEILAVNPQVCLGFEQEIELVTDPNLACNWTFHFRSVIAYGSAEKLTEPISRSKAINQIMLHYSDVDWEFSEKDLSKTILWRVKLDEITGKKSLKETE
ncbi:MAG: pyridoxamine 5'-phosphate oxidase family protein [Anaerolineales bacterium]|nr:pyridoxamine 5'-phosphate oxidase family protein [Anaerolineales bacterium]